MSSRGPCYNNNPQGLGFLFLPQVSGNHYTNSFNISSTSSMTNVSQCIVLLLPITSARGPGHILNWSLTMPSSSRRLLEPFIELLELIYRLTMSCSLPNLTRKLNRVVKGVWSRIYPQCNGVSWLLPPMGWPSTPKFDRATRPFL